MQNIDCQIKLGHLAEARDLAFDILRQDNLCAAAHLVVANTFLAECDSERNRTFARRHISQAIIVAEALGEEQVVKEARSQCDELDRIDESKGQSAERNKKDKEIGIDDGRNFKPDTDIALNFIFHPHLGFILNQVSDQQTKYSSNLPGFRYLRGEEVEYPHCPDDDAFIVGLFGGSVSGQLYLTIKRFCGRPLRNIHLSANVVSLSCSLRKAPTSSHSIFSRSHITLWAGRSSIWL